MARVFGQRDWRPARSVAVGGMEANSPQRGPFEGGKRRQNYFYVIDFVKKKCVFDVCNVLYRERPEPFRRE